uniref:auxin response factor 2A-like n=1 Tax=Erigeron canadensis TaxID=72917 RepID=UPI001CB9D03C|nr:auxin response factor 2A-like [Erigeron canadensis]
MLPSFVGPCGHMLTVPLGWWYWSLYKAHCGRRGEYQVLGNDEIDLHNQLWFQCAGLTAKVPSVGDKVFYFPQGHLEQVAACLHEQLGLEIPTYDLPPRILCKVTDVQLEVEAVTEEVFAKITLLPDLEEPGESAVPTIPEKVSSSTFRKILTASDTSTHGGCSVPKIPAEKTFPALDMSQESPSRGLVAKDLHGATWNFQHVYRGTPKRHLLTSGWSNFLSEKRLRAGDTCIFMRGIGRDEILIGIKRAVRQQNLCTGILWPNVQHGILSSARIALDTGTEFTVYDHPQSSAPTFLVGYDEVMESLKINYLPAMHFEMQLDIGEDDPEQILKKFSGTITGKDDVDPDRWLHSDWRCLRVQWDARHAAFRHLLPTRVSPWSIKLLLLAIQHQPPSVSVRQKRPMPFDPDIRNKPSSSRQDGTNSAHKIKLFGKCIG